MSYLKPGKSIFWQAFTVLLLLAAACREEFELETGAATAQLAVDGGITSEFKRHTVRLSQSGPYFSGGEYEPVSGAFVYIEDGRQTFTLRETAAGFYQTDSLAGQPETVYTLIVEWNDRTYTASDRMGAIPPPFEPMLFTTVGDAHEFEYRRHQFGFPEPYEWRLSLAPADTSLFEGIDFTQLGRQIGVDVVPPGIYHFTYYTHPNIEVNGLLNFEATNFYRFRPIRFVTQRRKSLSPGYYAFLRSVFMETEWKGGLFASTPANVRGNVNNDGLGYFSACAVREIAFILD